MSRTKGYRTYHFLLLLICLSVAQHGFANHLKGGWLQYTYVGPGSTAGYSKYTITVRQYLDSLSTSAQRDPNVIIGIFDGASNQMIQELTVNLTGSDYPSKKSYNPCISQPPPKVRYIIDYYTTTIDLPDNPNGYILAVQRCCRIINIQNMGGNSNEYGLTYTTKIPGRINNVWYNNNSSPVYAQKDTVLICHDTPFTFDFSAVDPDGDMLVYSFCDGVNGGDITTAGAKPDPPSNPPYASIPYKTPAFSGSMPLGSKVTIDPQTGLISGIAPSAVGDYVLSVCASEYRGGVLIGVTRKEIHVTVADCSLTASALKPSYITCNGYILSFENESSSSNITGYLWSFGEPGIPNDTSMQPTPTHTYKDTGTYTLKLKVTSTSGCEDSTTAPVKIYPGFKADFTVQSSCVLNPYQFFDATTSKYGTVNSWKWNFGDSLTLADTASSKDSAWKYSSARTAKVSLITTDTRGCIDTIIKTIQVLDKPSFNLPFRDTLICSNDTLPLKINITSGTVLWTVSPGPNVSRILNTSSVSPLVYPKDTTKYYVTVSDNGCTNKDSVTVNVLQFISVDAGPDTAICKTDTIRLHPISYALSYKWTASSGVSVDNVKNPLVKPLVNTRYYVIANLGKCQARDSVNTNVAPYPSALASNDVTICYGSRTQLSATVTGNSFSWQPTSSLLNEKTLTPIAGPDKTTAYILSVTDTSGCPKPYRDTVIVTVIPRIVADAGRDTIVASNQPLQLNATGPAGSSFSWSPADWLSNTNIANPVATIGNGIKSVVYTVRVSNGNCYSEDQVIVTVLNTGADILVPSAFTPNGDGKNDVIRPALIGITKFSYFNIYNRWGQLLFSTSEENKGWDGMFSGVKQPSGAYVYEALGTDYLGNTVFRKGTVVLIR